MKSFLLTVVSGPVRIYHIPSENMERKQLRAFPAALAASLPYGVERCFGVSES
jgi:hypothetical protein